jgi:glycosyltransferase involved in cell wall biosynthesis
LSILEKTGFARFSYVLAVSAMNPNKNFRGLVQAIKLLGDKAPPLVIAGSANAQVFGSDEPIPDSATLVGHVSDAQLRALYQHAGCFVFPSFYEGFGLPPLEAMACGCPVIAGDIPALRETCGNAALFCDPSNVRSIADQISALMSDQDVRQTLIERGHTHSEKFRWSETATETWKIIEEVKEGH